MVNSRQKGKVGEALVKKFLEENSGHIFDFSPGSGSGKIKGDLYIPKYKNNFIIEIKNYAESPLSDKVLTNSSSDLIKWWNKVNKESSLCDAKPLLFFRYNRSKLFVCIDNKPENVKNYIDIRLINCYIMLAEEWIKKENIEWVHI